MASKVIEVREGSQPVRDFVLRNSDIGDLVDPSVVVDITAYALRLTVKNDIADPDANALIDLLATKPTPLLGEYRFTFTTEQASLAPGDYVGEIRIWKAGDETKSPDDAIKVTYRVFQAVDRQP